MELTATDQAILLVAAQFSKRHRTHPVTETEVRTQAPDATDDIVRGVVALVNDRPVDPFDFGEGR